METWPQIKKRLVDMANGNRALMDGTMGPVWTIFDNSEVVFGVFPDPTEPDGVGTHGIKGRQLLKFIVESGVTEDLSVTAIPCDCFEQAEALRRVARRRRLIPKRRQH